MRKWWVGIILFVIYAYTIAEYVPFWVSFILFWGGVYYFSTGQKQKKKHVETINDQVSRIANKSDSDRFSPGATIVCSVAGVTFENRQETINEITVGKGVLLVRDRLNIYDDNAIEVFIYDGERKSIGFVPREIAEHISIHFDHFTTDQFPATGKVIGLSNPTNNTIGVKIQFRIPSEEWLRAEEMYVLYTSYPPF